MTSAETMRGAYNTLGDAISVLRAATETMIEHSGNGWPITPAEVSAAQRAWDEALDSVVGAAMWHGQLYERRLSEPSDD